MNNESLVSVIMPCYKMGEYIGEALESVAKQTYQHWEVIVVDDCGPDDGTREIVESFARIHPEHRVELIRHAENRGVSAARNTAIGEARGECLAFLDPDDLWGESYLQIHMEKLTSDDEITVSYTDARKIDNDGTVTGEVQGPKNEEEHEGLPQSLYWRNFINTSTVIARKESVLCCEGFDETPEMQHVEDWDLWLRMMDVGMKFSYTPMAQSFYRQHATASTTDLDLCRQRESALRRKHSELMERHSRAQLHMMRRRIEQLEGKQKAYEGSALFRLSRAVSRFFRR